MKQLMQAIGHTFHDEGLLSRALTHSSYANEYLKNSHESNERLEFLGDSVLSVTVSHFLYTVFPDLPEGELSKIRASLVCEDSLARFAGEISLVDYLKFGKGEQQNGGSRRKSTVSDAFEAVIGALFLDAGLDAARDFILPFVKEALKDWDEEAFKDYKTALQEVVQQNPEESVEYVIVEERGPAHAREFVAEVHLNSNVIGRGVGSSKKQAEQRAAREALQLMGL